MSLFFADLVREACWGVGAGDLPLGGPLPGHRRFADAVPAGGRFHYCIAGATDPAQWEVGEGEIGSGDTLIRLPIASSAAGAAVDFTAGLKTVALTVLADWFAARDAETIADIEGLETALDGKAELDGAAFAGAVSAPSLALSGPLTVVQGGGGQTAGRIVGPASTGLYVDFIGLGDNYYDANHHYFRLPDASLIAELNSGGLGVAGVIVVGGNQVLGTRRTGWATPSGTASRAAFDTATVTLESLAARVKALIDDLSAHGLIGA